MKQHDVHLFVFDSLSDWEIGFAVAGINSPQFQKNPGNSRIRTVALGKNPVMTMGGIHIIPDMALDMLSPKDSSMLILPGGIAWDEGKNMETVEVAAAFLGLGVPVAAICGATAGLARGGLLDCRRHTSNAPEYLAATQYCGAEFYENAPAVTDDNVITASGIAPIDFAYHIFRRLDFYSLQVLDAWYGLYKTGRPEYFDALMKAASA
ncbi:MAG: glutamine amidotransferase [Proteobacteria bacterium]|nr:glutamine amidotransferase [Pseudomonadota bacterium]